MTCDTCRLWLGKNIDHTTCPLKANLQCRRCCASGHTSGECTMNSSVVYPLYIEELIPQDVKDMYGITTQTTFIKPEKEVPVHDVRSFAVINNDKWLRAFLKQHNLHTGRKASDNLITIENWAKNQGLKIHFINQGV